MGHGATARTVTVAIVAMAASFTIGWIARAAQIRSVDQSLRRPSYATSHEERVLAARVLVAANKRRGVTTPPWVAALAAMER
jgi:hypothetical protein